MSGPRLGVGSCFNWMPRQSRKTAARRRILIRMLLELHALIRQGDLSHDEVLVALTIRLGHFEGRAMDVSDVARIADLPMSTVSRHIKKLRKVGRIRSMRSGRRTLQYFALETEHPEISTFYREIYRVVRQANIDISKMETSIVDKPLHFVSTYRGLGNLTTKR